MPVRGQHFSMLKKVQYFFSSKRYGEHTKSIGCNKEANRSLRTSPRKWPIENLGSKTMLQRSQGTSASGCPYHTISTECNGINQRESRQSTEISRTRTTRYGLNTKKYLFLKRKKRKDEDGLPTLAAEALWAHLKMEGGGSDPTAMQPPWFLSTLMSTSSYLLESNLARRRDGGEEDQMRFGSGGRRKKVKKNGGKKSCRRKPRLPLCPCLCRRLDSSFCPRLSPTRQNPSLK